MKTDTSNNALWFVNITNSFTVFFQLFRAFSELTQHDVNKVKLTHHNSQFLQIVHVKHVYKQG